MAKKLLLLCLTALFSTATWAYDDSTGDVFTDEESGMFFHTTSESTCELIAPQDDTTKYGRGTGEDTPFYIPSTATDESGTEYTVTRIDAKACYRQPIAGDIHIPSSVLSIGDQAFGDLEESRYIIFEDGEDELVLENTTSDGKIFHCEGDWDNPPGNINTIYLGRDIVYSGDDPKECSPFYDDSVYATHLQIGPYVTNIPDYLFCRSTNSGIQELVFDENSQLKSIGAYGFAEQDVATSALHSITLPATLESIGEGAFQHVLSLNEVTLLGSQATTVAPNIFGDADNTRNTTINLHVPEGSLETYEASAWNQVYYVVWADETPVEITVTASSMLGSYYYATYYNGTYQLGFTEGDVAPQVVPEVDDGYLESADWDATTYIIAGNAMLLISSNAEMKFEGTPANKTPFINTILYGSDEETTTSVNDVTEGYYFYMLSLDKDGENLGFYWGENGGAPFQSAAHKAWLALDEATASEISYISLKKGEGDTTGISSIETDVEGTNNGAIYTIQGVRVNDMTQPGIYIQNGKKVLVK